MTKSASTSGVSKVERIDVRGVNGYGPRCGCGATSKLHVLDYGDRDRDYFLCRQCSMDAVEDYIARTAQPSNGGPGPKVGQR